MTVPKVKRMEVEMSTGSWRTEESNDEEQRQARGGGRQANAPLEATGIDEGGTE